MSLSKSVITYPGGWYLSQVYQLQPLQYLTHTNTKLREGNLGGGCLNDLVVTINLMKLVLSWVIGAYAVQGDLKQFYASIKLVVRQWNLQQVLY